MAGRKIREVKGINKDGTPNAHWRRFIQSLDNFEQVSINDWKEEQILGYLLKRYKDHYGIPFSFSFTSSPKKCQELYCIKRMLSTVGTQKGWIAKDYIDWVFDTIIKPHNRELTSLAFFFNKDLCIKFKGVFQKRMKISRTTPLPKDYTDIISALGLSLQTYGDLAFVKMALDQNPTREDFESYNELFNQIHKLGFSDAILDNLEG